MNASPTQSEPHLGAPALAARFAEMIVLWVEMLLRALRDAAQRAPAPAPVAAEPAPPTPSIATAPRARRRRLPWFLRMLRGESVHFRFTRSVAPEESLAPDESLAPGEPAPRMARTLARPAFRRVTAPLALASRLAAPMARARPPPRRKTACRTCRIRTSRMLRYRNILPRIDRERRCA